MLALSSISHLSPSIVFSKGLQEPLKSTENAVLADTFTPSAEAGESTFRGSLPNLSIWGERGEGNNGRALMPLSQRGEGSSG